jgi:putative cardiolipin synthase
MRNVFYLLAFYLFFSGPALSAQRPVHIYRILHQERDALQCRLDLIRQAKQEILLSTYAIEEDVIGLATLQLLLEAARRGVSVRLLIDDFGSGLSECLLGYLEEQGVQAKVFNKFHLLKFRQNARRMHGKMLITDRKTLIVGGRNLKEEYYLLDSLSNFLDREVYVRSDSAVAEARRHFDNVWNHPKLSKRPGARLPEEQRQCWQQALQAAPDSLQGRLGLALPGRRDWNDGVKPAASAVEFIHDNFRLPLGRKRGWRMRKDRQATNELIGLVSKARHTIDIENSYYLPTRRWRRALKECLDRGVKIRLLTNSGYSTDVPFIQAVYRLRRGASLRAGMEIWEYRGHKMMHTKAMVIDGHISVIGSYNLDKLSHQYNTEVATWVDDRALATQHARLMDNILTRSVRVGEAPGPGVPAPTKIQRKRYRLYQVFRFTLAPLANWIL